MKAQHGNQIPRIPYFNFEYKTFCSIFVFLEDADVPASPVATEGALVGLAPQTKLQAPSN